VLKTDVSSPLAGALRFSRDCIKRGETIQEEQLMTFFPAPVSQQE